MTDNPEQYVNAEVWAKIAQIDDTYHKGQIESIFEDADKKYFVINFKTDEFDIHGYFSVNAFDNGMLSLFDPTKHLSGDDST